MHVVTRKYLYCRVLCGSGVLTINFFFGDTTVSLAPANVQASLGLQQCLVALKDLEVRVSD
jgi:hypothetical protein